MVESGVAQEMAATDQDLVSRAMCGNDEAFRDLVTRYARPVAAICRSLINGAAEDIEDAVQDVFVAAYESLPRLRDPMKFAAWLYGLARNIGLKHRAAVSRRFRAATSMDSARPSGADLATGTMQDSPVPGIGSGGVLEAVERLPEEYRTPFKLRHVEGFTHSKIAEILGLTLSGVNTRLFRARKMLRQCLDGRNPTWTASSSST